MTALVALAAGFGALLLVSPLLWPAPPAAPARPALRLIRRGCELVRARLDDAGLPGVPVPAYPVAAVLTAAAGAGLAWSVLPSPAALLLGAACGLAAPEGLLQSRRRARQRRNRGAWPDVVDLLLARIRSGGGVPEALAALALTGPPHLRSDFARFDREYAASGMLGIALDGLKERLADPVADRILEVVRMTRDVGGADLPRVLRALAAYLRQEQAVRAEVEARQSWAVNAARLGVAAPWIVVVLLSSRPEAAAAYARPEAVGLLLAGAIVSVVAYRLMRRIGRLPEQSRWLR